MTTPTTPWPDNAFDFTQVHNVQSPLDMSHSHSINTLPSIYISEDLVAGRRLNGRMSNVRRFFCLFVTFDFLFTSLMWIICVMLNGEYIIKALTEQVIHYSIQTSLFDIVLVSFIRFCILLLFYAIIYINHWIVISLSTAITCGFLITKVLYFDWPHSSQPIFEVLLVLVSFILSWGEAWFLDFRVIPQEMYANHLVIGTENERTPLIRSFMQNLPSTYTESYANFYSPQGSPEGSMCRYQQYDNAFEYPRVVFTKQEEEHYKNLAKKNLKETWDLFDKDGWVLEKTNQNDCIYSTTINKKKKIFKLRGEINVCPRFLLEELYYKQRDSPKWNSTVKECHKVHTFNDRIDITHTISNESAGGFVASREFVDLRHWDQRNNKYIISVCKTEHPSVPVKKKPVRGENGTGGFVIEKTSDPNKCVLYWMVNVDIKMRLVGGLLDKELPEMMFNFIKNLRDHMSKSYNNV